MVWFVCDKVMTTMDPLHRHHYKSKYRHKSKYRNMSKYGTNLNIETCLNTEYQVTVVNLHIERQ